MPKDPSRPQSWKGEDRSALPGGRRPGEGAKYSWKAAGPTSGPPTGRKLKAGFAAFLGLFIVAGLAWLVYQLLPTRPTCVTVVAADPRLIADNLSLPLNIYGHRDARDFLSWANSGDRAARKWCTLLGDRAAPWPVSTGRREDDWLKALADRKEDGIILYLPQPGGTDENGKPFLFDEQGGRFDVLKLIQALKPVGKKKFLIFDATQTPTDWRNGVLVNQFADGLKKLAPEIAADPNLLVLCSSSPGQRSWVSEEFGRSIFAHFLMEGLSGGAIGGKSGPINPGDLLTFVRGKVDDWVQRNRADNQRPFRQEPMLLPAGAETSDFAMKFTLAYGDPNYQATATPTRRSLKTDELQKAWDACDKLAAKVPGPWVNSPRGWRRYRELLLRYETALRAGDDDVAGKISGAIASLGVKLDAERAAPGGEAVSAGLAMPAALGRDAPVSEIKLNELLDSKDPLAPGLKSLAAGGDETLPRLKLIGYMLKVAAEKPEKFADVVKRIGEVDDGGASRPAEAHLAVMLAKQVVLPGGTKPAPDLIRLAIEVRRLAEDATLSVGLAPGHPYSERLSRQLADDVTKADRDRRRGEDLLFAALEPHHAEAKKLLQSAKAQYEQVRLKAAPARRACEVRDAVFADLPFLTEWASLDSATLSDAQQRQPETLWKDGHALADRVSQLDPLHDGGSKVDPNEKELSAHAEDVWTEFTALAKVHRGIVSSLADAPESTTQSLRQRIECVLAVPGPLFPAAERVKLVTRVREIGFKLAQGSQTATPGNAVAEAELAKNVARYARAQMGKTVVDGLSDTALKKTFELVDDQSLGTQLALHWKKLRMETDRDDADKLPIPLYWRERLGLLSGTAGEQKQKREPSLITREERWKAAFRRLARRAELDHWYDGNDKPFSETIARKFLKGLPPEEGTNLAKQMEERRGSGKFQVTPPPDRTLTTEREVAPIFTIGKVNENFDPGFAVIAPKLDATALRLKDEAVPQPIELNIVQPKSVPLVAPEFLDRLKDPRDVNLTLVGCYRGQAVTAAIAKLPIKPFPDLTVSRPPPPQTAQIAARADDNLDLGAISIVFDCSGSMKIPYFDPVTKSNVKKIDAAKNALAQFEKKLPNGALVSLWAYGHDSSPSDDIQLLLPQTIWDRNRPTLLSDRIDPLVPRAFTPLLETMIRAASEDAFEKCRSNKTLLVLTDGCDEKKDVPKSLDYDNDVSKRFSDAFVAHDRKVSIRMITFRVGDDKVHADAQFKNINKVPMPSSMDDATSGQMVVDLMAEAMRPRVALLRGNVQVSKTAFVAKRETEALDWHPDPSLSEFGEYEMNCRGQGRRILLDAGDRLALRIRKSSNGLRFTRLLMADEPARLGFKVLDGNNENDPFALGMSDQILNPGSTTTQGKFTLEDRRAARAMDNDSNGVSRLDRPRWIWWEFTGIGRAGVPSGSTVTQLYDSQAPMWELRSDQWPLAGVDRLKPRVEVWATGSEPEAALTRELAPGEKLTDVAVEGNDDKLESAGFERAMIPMVDRTNKEVECLVVRVYSPLGVKYHVQIVGSTPQAEVHRYFNDAKRSTSAFWLRDDAKGKTLRIKLINIDTVKTKSTRLGRELVE